VDRECKIDKLDVKANINVKLIVLFVLRDMEQVLVNRDVRANVKVIVTIFVNVKVKVIVV